MQNLVSILQNTQIIQISIVLRFWESYFHYVVHSLYLKLECEDASSGGDFSEPNSPNHLTSRKSFELQQDEINRRYQILRAKLDKEFENKRKEWQKLKSNRGMDYLD